MPDAREHIGPNTFLRYRARYRFWPHLSMVKNNFKNQKILISESGFGSSPKSNQFILVTHRTCPQNFIRIRAQLFEISCTQTNRQTERGENITSFSFGGGGNDCRGCCCRLRIPQHFSRPLLRKVGYSPKQISMLMRQAYFGSECYVGRTFLVRRRPHLDLKQRNIASRCFWEATLKEWKGHPKDDASELSTSSGQS